MLSLATEGIYIIDDRSEGMSLRRGKSIEPPGPVAELLPDWIFDVDETDETPLSDQSILEELEIDIMHIRKVSIYMLSNVMRKVYKFIDPRHILVESVHPLAGEAPFEFWGPFAVVSLYTSILWLGRVRNVSWIFFVWVFFSLFMHVVARVSFKSTLALHISILGYSILPIIPFSLIVALFRLPVWVASTAQSAAVLWASSSAYNSYQMILSEKAMVNYSLMVLRDIINNVI